MVVNTIKTFRELFKERLDLYDNITPAAALFYDHNGSVGLRLEAPSIAKEFVDKLPFGRDPEGILFYGSIEDIDGEATYSVFSNHGTQVAQGQEAVVVQFFDSDNNMYAEFVGQDPTRSVTHTAEGKKGDWVTIDQGWANAKISKSTKSTTIHIKIPSIGKQVKIDFGTIAAAVAANKKAIHHDGNVFFKKVSDMVAPSRVDFNDDRVLFYHNTTTNDPNLKDLVAVFIPVETVADDAHALGDLNFQTPLTAPAVWSTL
ncbi:hypothetical protein K439DRAFT_1612098 [Ramaria rubella]|nr:hypothetical protein K439DRAFT_1612098 [Ramaria rubella]